MLYSELYQRLKIALNQDERLFEIDGFDFLQSSFTSHSTFVLPGDDQRYCQNHAQNYEAYYNSNEGLNDFNHDVNVKDNEVKENVSFNYQILAPKGKNKLKKVVFLFHGFNEKSWDKYLPWAAAIADRLNCGVVLFPIAFHMQRAPQSWSDKRKMFELSNKRKQQFPNIINSTLSNAAISVRMQSLPQRFIWSGLQTYYDVIQLIESIKNDQNEWIDPDFSFDIFAYSIGGFLGEILLLTNHKNYFSNSKLCLFCSGPVFNRLSAVSKFILDSEANVALYSYLVEHFEAFLVKDAYLNHYMNGTHTEGKVFSAMLEFKRLREYRESLLKQFEDQIYAIGLKNDTVIPAFEIINTLNGAYRDIRIKVETMDFAFDYSHETPFPVKNKNKDEVNLAFNEVFDKYCAFLKS